MTNVYVKNIVRFVLLVLLQVLILNNMNLSGYMNPYVYVLFILLLPVDINKSLLLVIAFLTGLTMDVFGNTPGLNAFSTVLLAFARPGVLRMLTKNIDFIPDEEPGLVRLGFGKFLRYVLVLVFLHHVALFFLEIFSFHDFLNTLYRILINTFLSTFIIMILVLLFSKRKT